ncbi:MAG TPA: DUF4760 domain-containing protein [Parafilimonas sp.]|nr:DUF4760 domain-containing protein [Parafilimonas sp.]
MEIIEPKLPPPDQFKIRYAVLVVGFIILSLALLIIYLVDKPNQQHIKLADYISMASFGSVTIGLIYTAISFQYSYKVDLIKAAREEKRLLEQGKRENQLKKEAEFAEKERMKSLEEKENAIAQKQDRIYQQKTELNEKHHKQILENTRIRIDYDKLKFTVEMCAIWYRGDMALNVETSKRLIMPYKDKLNHPDQLERFKNQLDSNDGFEQRKSLIAVLNYLELISHLVTKDVLDKDFVKANFQTIFIHYFKHVAAFIKSRQIEAPRVYREFMSLAEDWHRNSN